MKATINNNGKTATIESDPATVKQVLGVLLDYMIEQTEKPKLNTLVQIKKKLTQRRKVRADAELQQAVMKNKQYQKSEINLIEKYYGMRRGKGGHIKKRNLDNLCNALPHRSRESIMSKAFNIGQGIKSVKRQEISAMKGWGL